MAKIGFNVYIDTDVVSPNVLGELWMNMINPEGRWGYTAANIVVPHQRLEMDLNEPFDDMVCSLVVPYDETAQDVAWHIQKVRFPTLNLTGYMYWDGDGTMVLHHDSGYAVYSTDYKHDDEWKEF